MDVKLVLPGEYETERQAYDPVTNQVTLTPLFVTDRGQARIATILVSSVHPETQVVTKKVYTLQLSGQTGRLLLADHSRLRKPRLERKKEDGGRQFPRRKTEARSSAADSAAGTAGADAGSGSSVDSHAGGLRPGH